MLVYKGVEDGGKVAVFELTGTSSPRATASATRAGGLPVPQAARRRDGVHHRHRTGTETDAQYQLDLVKIYKSDAKVSKESLDAESEA